MKLSLLLSIKRLYVIYLIIYIAIIDNRVTNAINNSFSVRLFNNHNNTRKRIVFHNASLGIKHNYQSDNATSEYCEFLKRNSRKFSDGSIRLSFTPNRKPQKETVANAKLITVLVDDNLYLLTTWESWKPNYFLHGRRSVVILFDYVKYMLLQDQKDSIKDLDSFYSNLFEVNLGLTPACVEIPSNSSYSHTNISNCNHYVNIDQGYRVYSYSGPTNKSNYGVVFASVYKFPNPYLSQLYDDTEYGSIEDWQDSCFRGHFDFMKYDDSLSRCMNASRFNSTNIYLSKLMPSSDTASSRSTPKAYRNRRQLGGESYTYIKYNTWYPHGSFHLDLIDYFDYFMKLDSDIWLHRPIPANMLTHMARDGAYLATGFTELTRDGDRGQVNETNAYVSALGQTCKLKLVPAFYPKRVNEFNAVNYGNFMVTWLGFFTSPQLMHYSRGWSKASSMFYHRWGDQQYWTLALLWFQRHKNAPLVTYLNYSDFRSHLWGDIDKQYMFNHKISCTKVDMYTTTQTAAESLALKMKVFHKCNLSITY